MWFGRANQKSLILVQKVEHDWENNNKMYSSYTKLKGRKKAAPRLQCAASCKW